MSKLSRTLLMAFAALGLGAASASSYVHYHLLTDPSYSSFCDVNATVNCTQAYLSSYGSLFGVPVETAATAAEFRERLTRAFAHNGPVVIEALVNSREYDDLVLKKDKA